MLFNKLIMKNILFLLIICILTSCSIESPNNKIYGDQNMTKEGKISGQELLNELAVNDSVQVKVEAVINSICQKKGCWMYIDLNEETEMLVRFKDYSFFVPREGMKNKDAVISGVLFYDTINVNSLKHYAYDEGKSKEEINLIKKPKLSFSFIAEGVYIK